MAHRTPWSRRGVDPHEDPVPAVRHPASRRAADASSSTPHQDMHRRHDAEARTHSAARDADLLMAGRRKMAVPMSRSARQRVPVQLGRRDPPHLTSRESD
ncbi:hypothetical protein K3495_g1946 [Podosphaera aphanis]|nr:hypothetical protein K3495_g1946 [Podosphaera aphanis]